MEMYVHGYSTTEASRLTDQADTLAELLHSGISYPPGTRVLEAGCGIGAQTVHLARNNPGARFVSFDASKESVAGARKRLAEEGVQNVVLEVADVYELPYESGSYDHVFVCFLLEHLNDPVRALAELRRVLRPGGTISVIEGDHGSYYCHPRSDAADHVVQCLIEIQTRKRGNALIGRQLYPMIVDAGYKNTRINPRIVYVDGSRPELIEGFTKKTFIAMIEGVEHEAIRAGLSNEELWNRGIADLYKTATEYGTFCYTFFCATASK